MSCWERDVLHYRRMKDGGLVPYQEVRLWRHRFWLVAIYAAAVSGLLMAAIQR